MSRRSSYYLGGRRKLYPVGPDCVLYHDYGLGDAIDHSIYGNDGTVTGATFVENGLSFDGTDDYEDIGPDDSLGPYAVTVIMWIYLPTAPETWDHVLGMQYTDETHNMGYLLHYWVTGGGGLSFAINYYDPSSNGAMANYNPEATETWIHYAATFAKPNIRIYRNTVEGTPRVLNEDLAYRTTAMRLGKAAGFTAINMILGELLIFNVEKNSTQIADHRNFTKARYGVA